MFQPEPVFHLAGEALRPLAPPLPPPLFLLLVVLPFPSGQRLVLGPRGLPPQTFPALEFVQLDGDRFLNAFLLQKLWVLNLLVVLRVLDFGVARGLGGLGVLDAGALLSFVSSGLLRLSFL